jgi:hypothetical protein
MANPVLAEKYDPRVNEATALGPNYQISSFPWCCGVSVVTGLEKVKRIDLLSAWYTKNGGTLLWTQKSRVITPMMRDQLVEAGWICTKFPSRMEGHYPVEMWTYVGKEEDIVSPHDFADLAYGTMWPHQQARIPPKWEITAMSKGPIQRTQGQGTATLIDT